MVQSAISTVEPLPPIDIEEFSKELEVSYWGLAFAFKSKHSEWWQRTSISQWLEFMKLARRYQIPLARNMLNLVRATLLYDTLAMRLDSEIDICYEFNRYVEHLGRKSRKRLRKKILKLFSDPVNFYNFERLLDLGNLAEYRVAQFLDAPRYNILFLVDKVSYAVSSTIKRMTYLLLITTFITFIIVSIDLIQGQEIIPYNIVRQLFDNRAYQFLLFLFFIMNIRQILFRLQDKIID
jgi:hypothetical protein